ncbi:MAG: ferric reductase-like transmembrane domain-containing protein [Candidatus Saccharibacteria bacterium]|nr:ferric reductase-like transmembrane domain-containing protein [Candidatus Saccharibacteria bacterium]
MKIKLLTMFLVIFVGTSILLQPEVVYAQTASNDSISVQTIEGPTVSSKVIEQAKHSWPWYVARGSGFVAAITLVLLMLSGIGQITGQTYRFLEPLTAWASHRALGILFLVSIIMHMFVFLFDKFIAFSILDILIPWFSDFKPVTMFGINLGSFYLALGIVAFYLSLLIVVTSLLIINKKPKSWKLLHLLSYVLMLFVFFHALLIGTDLAEGWIKGVWIVMGNLLSFAVIIRTWRAYTT